MIQFEWDVWVEEDELRRERAKARDLRQTQWWKNKRATGICHYCRGQFPPRELTMDHIVPLVRGGKSAKSNLAPCCKPCNTRKMNLIPSEWQSYMEDLAARNPNR